MKIIRIRRYSGIKGGKNYYHHADLYANNTKEALIRAKTCGYWRWIDTFDTSDSDYVRYESLGEIDKDDARSVE